MADIFPGRSEQDILEHLAAHFNGISSEIQPLNHVTDIPPARSRQLPILPPLENALRLRKFKKPKSMVRGDIFPDLVTKYADLLAIPLTAIYNDITATGKWLKIGKNESVTIIPKTRRSPNEIG